jgi:hypothetical protein
MIIIATAMWHIQYFANGHFIFEFFLLLRLFRGHFHVWLVAAVSAVVAAANFGASSTTLLAHPQNRWHIGTKVLRRPVSH